MKKHLPQISICLALVLVAVISSLFVAEWFSDPNTYKSVMESIDEKTETVLTLSGSSALASTAISLLPGDAATPLADKLMDLSGYFLLILSVLYAEKYIMTLLGLAVFRCVIPFACITGIVSTVRSSAPLRRFAVKVTVFALSLLFVIPTCMKVSDMVYSTYEESLQGTAAAANELVDSTVDAEDENGSFIDTIVDSVVGTVSSLTTKATKLITSFVESIAVLIVTTCVIPILSLLLFVWMIKTFTGWDVLPALSKASDVFKFGAKKRAAAADADNAAEETLTVR